CSDCAVARRSKLAGMSMDAPGGCDGQGGHVFADRMRKPWLPSGVEPEMPDDRSISGPSCDDPRRRTWCADRMFRCSAGLSYRGEPLAGIEPATTPFAVVTDRLRPAPLECVEKECKGPPAIP